MRARLGAFMVAVALAVSACSSDGGSSPTPSETGAIGSTSKSPGSEATIVTSDDGLLSVSIPPGVAEGVDVTITQTDEVPPELEELDIRGTFYELGPDGTELEMPVTITRIVDPETAGFDLSRAIPTILLASRSSDGTWEWLEDQVLVVEDGKLSSRTGSWSPRPPLTSARSRRSAARSAWSSRRQLTLKPGLVPDVPGLSHAQVERFTCAAEGTGTYRVVVPLEEDCRDSSRRSSVPSSRPSRSPDASDA